MQHRKVMKLDEKFWRKLNHPLPFTAERFYKISGIDKFIKRNNLTREVTSINQVLIGAEDYNRIADIFANNPLVKLQLPEHLRSFYFHNIVGTALPTYKKGIPAGEVWFEWNDNE